jgi:hypothetical protein
LDEEYMSRSEEKVVRLRIVCLGPPDPIEHDAEFGIQDRKRTVVEKPLDGDGNVHYDVEARAQWHAKKECPNFLGPWTNGTVEQRFLYLAWSPLDPDASGLHVWNRRMKIHLKSITWEQIEEADAPGTLLVARVNGRDSAGGIACASVPLLDDGWVVAEALDFEPIEPA